MSHDWPAEAELENELHKHFASLCDFSGAVLTYMWCFVPAFQGVGGVPGMVPLVKRTAVSDGKGGLPVYQPSSGTTAYQQALAMQLQQPYAPVTSESMCEFTQSKDSGVA